MTMQIARNTVVTLDYNVTDPDGNVVDEGREPLVYLHGGYGDIFDKIEEALQDRQISDVVKVKLQPEEAFGEYDENLVQVEPRSSFPKETQVGMQFESAAEGEGDDEEDDIIIYRVTEMTDDTVVLDGNHPLAGTALIFTCTVTEVRPATAEEIEQGTVSIEDEDDEPPTRH